MRIACLTKKVYLYAGCPNTQTKVGGEFCCPENPHL